MSRPLTRPLRRVGARLRTRRGLRATVVAAAATVATALLTAGSQAPGVRRCRRFPDGRRRERSRRIRGSGHPAPPSSPRRATTPTTSNCRL